jgi:hypothetical protein
MNHKLVFAFWASLFLIAIPLACTSGEKVPGKTGTGTGTGNTTGAGTGNSTGAGTGNSTGAGTGNSTGAGTGNTTGAGTGNTTGAGTGNVTGAGTGNTTGGGGTTGAGGAALIWNMSCTPTAPLISDMEDGNYYYGMDSATTYGCPKGAWYLSSGTGSITMGLATGPSGTVTPVAITDNGASTHCIHVAGMGQQNTSGMYNAFVSLSASLNSPSSTQTGSLDASAYSGISFSYKLTAGTGTGEGVRVQVSNEFTNPAGGMCSGSGATQCYDHPGMTLTNAASWTKQTVMFSQLTQEGFGNASPATFPKTHVYSVEWKVLIPMTAAVTAWDLWIDDLTFVQ